MPALGLKRVLRIGVGALLAAAWWLAAAPLPAAYAAGIGVTTTTDELNHDGDCSLREAIRAANLDTSVDACTSGGGADSITLPAGMYTLSIPGRGEDMAATGDLDLTSDVTISGAGAGTTIISANDLDRAIDVLIDVRVTIQGVTIQGGNVPDHGGGITNAGMLTVNNSAVSSNRTSSYLGGSGSGIFNQGTLTITNSTVSKNSNWPFGEGGGVSNTGLLTIERSTIAENVSSTGGGVVNYGTASISASSVTANESMPADTGGAGGGIWNSGTLTLSRSMIQNNRALFGGGISNRRDSSMTITESTIAGNHVLASRFDSTGGGMLNQGSVTVVNSTISGNIADGIGGGLASYGTTSLNNVTIAQNRADPAPYVIGGGLFVGNGTVTAKNTLIGGNTDTSGQAPDCAFGFTSQGYNLVQNPVNCMISGDPTGNLLGVDPRLGPLQDNGGPTPTHALLSGSPAIDAGHPAAPGSGEYACAATDQRGITRPQDGNGDGVARCDIGAYELEGQAPAVPGKVTGGGTIRGQHGGKAHFSLAVQRKAAGGPISGSLEYRDAQANVQLRQAIFHSLTVAGQSATITGTATVNGQRGVSFTVTVRDGGEPGRNRDTFNIRLGTGYTNQGSLTGGNLQVHKP
jgi:CSLREA domain-containing protein